MCYDIFANEVDMEVPMKKKQSLLSLYSILSMHSDENHPITRK